MLLLASQSYASGLNFKKSPLTTKGDIYTYASSDGVISVGANGTVLSADSSTATGLNWVAIPTSSATVSNSGTLTSNSVIIGQGTTVISAITADTSTTDALFSTSGAPAFRQIISNDVIQGTWPATRGGTGQITYTKGDLLAGFALTQLNKLGVGSNGTVLSADSAATNGIKWAEASPLTTKGDIYVYGPTTTRLPVGANGTHLSADSSAALGVSWQKTNLADQSAITGTTAVGNGGTGATSLTAGGVLIGNGTSPILASTLVSTDATGTKLSIGYGTSTLVSLDVAGNFRTIPIVLSEDGVIPIDASRSNIFTVTLTGNRTLGTPTNPSNGQKITIIVSQDATGSRTLAYSPAFRFGTDVASPTLSTTAGLQDYLGFQYNARGTVARYLSWDAVSVVKGFSS